MTQTFSGPVDRLPFAPPLHQWRWERGRTVYRTGEAWVETTEPLQSVLEAADVVAVADRPGGEKMDGRRDYYVFRGGYVYEVSDAVATELTTAGYGSYLS